VVVRGGLGRASWSRSHGGQEAVERDGVFGYLVGIWRGGRGGRGGAGSKGGAWLVDRGFRRELEGPRLGGLVDSALEVYF
jgi:hypothetical protein